MKKAVAGIVNHNGMILIGKKDSNKEGFLSGKWHIPGETLEKNEDYVTALIRGFREETGIEIKVGKFLGSHLTSTHTKVEWYECFALSYDITPGSDFVKAKWISKKEILNYIDHDIRGYWPLSVLEYFNL